MAFIFGNSGTSIPATRNPSPTRREAGGQAPLGFYPNAGARYINHQITYENGSTGPAKYINVAMTDDPKVLGRRNDDPTVYVSPLYARPSEGDRRRYQDEDMEILGRYSVIQPHIDRALCRIGDITLQAELQRYRALGCELVRLEGEIARGEDTLNAKTKAARACIRRLENTHVICYDRCRARLT